jgi:hypothetical protein
MQSLVSPVLDKFVVLLDELIRLTQTTPRPNDPASTANQKRMLILAQCLSHAMSAIAWSSKAFTNVQTIKAAGCLPVYLKALEVFLRAVQVSFKEILGGLEHVYVINSLFC